MTTEHWDCLVVGAGFSGLVVAENLTQNGIKCLIVEKRDHIGGNCYDYYDEAGVLVHKYGPHIFHTSSKRVIDYLSRFTEWIPNNGKVRSFTRGKIWSFPINLETFEQYIGKPSTTEEFEKWIEENKVQIDDPQNSEEVIISQVGWEMYEMFFKGYTKKQWKMEPKDLDPSVCGRVPIRKNRDDSYFRDTFQAMPRDGFTAIFNKMLEAMGDKAKLVLNNDWRHYVDAHNVKYDWLVYTGPVDEYFGNCHGRLPYRSLRFEHESFTEAQLKEREAISKVPGMYQEAMHISYPDEDVPYTRITELKHATQQKCPNTTIVKEFPDDFTEGKVPYYPVPFPESKIQYAKYKKLADAECESKNVSFVGRLATYKYYNMDQCVGLALTEAEKILENFEKIKPQT